MGVKKLLLKCGIFDTKNLYYILLYINIELTDFIGTSRQEKDTATLTMLNLRIEMTGAH